MTSVFDSPNLYREYYSVNVVEGQAERLVPVTNAVAGVPEFVDETCGILAPNENYNAVADGILYLVSNPDKFIEMSENAAKKVRAKTASEITIPQELSLFGR